MSLVRCYSAWGYEATNRNFDSYNQYISENTFTGKSGTVEAKNDLVLSEIKTMNAFKVIGYIPGVGTFMGIVRIVVFCTTRSNTSDRIEHIIRGCFEILGLGFFLIFVDIAVTFKSYLSQNLDFPSVPSVDP